MGLRNKKELLSYFRNKAENSLEKIEKELSKKDYREKAKRINKELYSIRETLISGLRDNKLSNNELLNQVLLITYCSYIVMIEYRNKVWKYEYMAFSRRIGELWDPFCQLCWKYNENPNISLFEPPTFKEVKGKLQEEIKLFIEKLNISKEERSELLEYYSLTWNLLTSGEINMKLDLHFEKDNKKYVVDLKSGFNSNEKGNTNRLLLVASIYNALKEKYGRILFVRSNEDESNHYLQTLKKSGLWEVYCGDGAYNKMKEITGFDIKAWINKNIAWKEDFDKETMNYFEENNLDIYLKW